MAELLRHENALHLDLRALSFRFVFDPPGPPKSATTSSATRPPARAR